MKPPVEHVRVSAKGKELLLKIKRRTGLEHWNEICRVALCWSLANPTPPPMAVKSGDSSIDMDWKTFAGIYNEIIAGMIILRASKDGINTSLKECIADYVRAHIERGIVNIQNTNNVLDIFYLKDQ